MNEIRHYIADDGRDTFAEWRSKITDTRTRIAIDRRLYRVEQGNFGDHKPCRDGVWELRIDLGPGYRVSRAVGQDRRSTALGRRQAQPDGRH